MTPERLAELKKWCSECVNRKCNDMLIDTETVSLLIAEVERLKEYESFMAATGRLGPLVPVEIDATTASDETNTPELVEIAQ
jgi:hypothetical protein